MLRNQVISVFVYKTKHDLRLVSLCKTMLPTWQLTKQFRWQRLAFYVRHLGQCQQITFTAHKTPGPLAAIKSEYILSHSASISPLIALWKCCYYQWYNNILISSWLETYIEFVIKWSHDDEHYNDNNDDCNGDDSSFLSSTSNNCNKSRIYSTL